MNSSGAHPSLSRLDLRDRLFHQADHRGADVLVGLRDAFGVEILAHLGNTPSSPASLNRPSPFPSRKRSHRASGDAHFQPPHSEQFVAPCIGLEAQILVMSEFLLEAFFALVECRHIVSLSAFGTRGMLENYHVAALHISSRASRQSTVRVASRGCARHQVGLCRLYCTA